MFTSTSGITNAGAGVVCCANVVASVGTTVGEIVVGASVAMEKRIEYPFNGLILL